MTECPSNHTLCPESYLAWHRWAEEKSKTHRQVQCEGCGRFLIWVPKTGGVMADWPKAVEDYDQYLRELRQDTLWRVHLADAAIEAPKAMVDDAIDLWGPCHEEPKGHEHLLRHLARRVDQP